MNETPISPAVKQFIAEQIRSVIELECLLLLVRDQSVQWTAAELGHELRVDEQWTTRHLADLTQRGLVSSNGALPPRYHYDPKTPSLNESVQQLAIHYAERRVSVIELIYAKPPDPLESFADAFRFRKERRDG